MLEGERKLPPLPCLYDEKSDEARPSDLMDKHCSSS